MNIAINARVLNERKGGPYRYTINILRELSKLDRTNTYYILLYDDYDFDFELPKNYKIIIKKIKSKVYFDYIYLPLFSKSHNIDVWFFPKNTFSPLIKGKKVPVFHDIVYFEKDLNFREFKFFDNLHHSIMIPINGKIADINIAVSEFTASRMKELLHIPEDKIKIIKEGVEKKFTVIKDKMRLEHVKERLGLSLPFFFYSGSLSPRKNMLAVLHAFQKVQKEIPHVMYYTGGYSWLDNEVISYIENNNLKSRVIKLGYVSDEDLVVLYNLADCYLYPSIYEGFGLPILEAQACGCPVITSNVSSCPEVAGEGALLVDPRNVDEISRAMLKIVKNENFRNSIVKRGLENVKKYSWHKCAKELLNTFEYIANNL